MLLVESAIVDDQEHRFKEKTLTVAASSWGGSPQQTAKAQVYHTGEDSKGGVPRQSQHCRGPEARQIHLTLLTRSLLLLTTLLVSCLLCSDH